MGLKPRRPPKWDLKSEVMQNHVQNDRGLTWTSSNGSHKSIAVMDTNHIKNALAKIKRGELDNRKNMVPVLEMELLYRSVCEISEKNERKQHEQTVSSSIYGLQV